MGLKEVLDSTAAVPKKFLLCAWLMCNVMIVAMCAYIAQAASWIYVIGIILWHNTYKLLEDI